MNRLELEAKLATIKELSTLPETMAEIVRVCQAPEISLTQLANTVQRDPALVARVLKVANSPYYKRSQEIGSITQAVSTMGANQVKALALSLSIHEFTSRIGNSIDHREFWRHSLCVACTAETIARKIKSPHIEEAFVLGCLHDLGMIVLDQLFAENYAKVCKTLSEERDILSAERAILGTDHTVAGAMLAEMWSFPPLYAEAIGKHHDILRKADAKRPQIVRILNLADRLATFTIEGSMSSKDNDLPSRATLGDSLGLSVADLKQIVVDSLSSFLRTSAYMDIEVGSPLVLLEQAATQLYDLYSGMEQQFQELRDTRNKLHEEQLRLAAYESLQAIVATFSHYLNNAAATISGRTQLLELALEKNEIDDKTGVVAKSIIAYTKSSDQIVSVITSLKNLNVVETAVYHADTKIIDLAKGARQESLTAPSVASLGASAPVDAAKPR
ncbi:MAG: HDOD domain-containing protein [bacterium]